MIIPDKLITEMDLRRNNGEHGYPKHIAYEGIVYDVTECPRWLKELYERMYFPGQDLSGEMEEAPHKADVFNRPCVKTVGRLKSLD